MAPVWHLSGGTWDRLSMNVKPLLSELPHLEPTVKELEAVIFEGRALQGIQETHRKQLRETTKRGKERSTIGSPQ